MNKPVKERMIELMEPIDRQIMMCDDRHDQLMLACAMLTIFLIFISAKMVVNKCLKILYD
jgi:hypothetical protein